MNNLLMSVYFKIQTLFEREDGQDLVEYALLITLVSLSAVTGVRRVASAINLVFSNISATL
jgi:pilus assembly protein Flp/PilA